VPKLGSGNGQEQAKPMHVVLACLDEWNLRSKISGLCFDTTASNTGRHSGACILTEQILGRVLLHLACHANTTYWKALKITAAISGQDIAIFIEFIVSRVSHNFP